MSRQTGLVVRFAVLVVTALMSATWPVFADAPSAPGANTGDGSTPFTGLAQAPEANLFAGSAATEIPILVPPGRNALTPKLALSYSSSAGPSPYGYGWDLPLGKIQRSTKHGAVRCGAEPFDYVLTLPGANVECTVDASLRCFPNVEESFLRIQYRFESDSWEAWDKSGLHYFFGDEQTARQPVFPAAGCSTFAWQLTRVEDLNGNYVRLVYAYDATARVSYPDSIVYGGNSHTGFAAPFEVRFVWRESHACADGRAAGRPCEDRVVNSIGGFPAELTQLLDRLEVRFGSTLVRAYQLQYDIDSPDSARRGRQSFLTAVTLVDGEEQALSRADGAPASTTFLYHQPLASQLGFGAAQSTEKPMLESPELLRWTQRSGVDRAARRDVFDVNGDAIPDIVDAHDDCETWGESPPYALSANWDVYLGSAEGYATTPLKWSISLPTLDQQLYCPPIRSSRSNAAGDVWWSFETVDLTGDSIPDYVVTWTWTPQHRFWRVFPGTAQADGAGWGFGPGVDWPAPYAEFRWSVAVDSVLGWHGTVDRRDLVDLNADGLPDLVDATTAPWLVWYNNGVGFDTNPTPFNTTWAYLRVTTDFGLQVAGVADVNGDGLLDQIHAWERYGGAAYSGKWLVRLNTGSGVSSVQDWALPASGCNWPGNRPWNGLRQSIGDGTVNGGTDVVRDFFDANGDGLPDVVEACNTSAIIPYWTVWLNRGSGFAPAQQWFTSSTRIRSERVAGATVTDTFDADGDGLIDFVDFSAAANKIRITRNATGAWRSIDGTTIEVNADGGRPDLLVQMENGLGGSTFLEYLPSTAWDNTDAAGVPHLPWVQWTVTRIERDDGLCGAAGGPLCDADSGSHSLATRIDYAFGRYEPLAREFRGFRTVREIDVAGNTRNTFFHQDAARRGKTEAINRYSGESDLLTAEASGWQCVDLQPGCAGDVSTCPVLSTCPSTAASGRRLWTRLAQALHYDTTDHVIRKVAGFTNLAWDAYGNVTRTSRGGSGSLPVETLTSFVHQDTPARYLVDRAASTEVVEATGGTAMRRLTASWSSYDAYGNLSSTLKWLDRVVDPRLPGGVACPGGLCARLEMRYDPYGNLIEAIDANGRSTWTTYDDVTHIYPSSVRNAVNQVVATAYDPACGTLLIRSILHWSFDASAPPLTVYQHDSFCRLVSVLRSGDTAARPSVRYTHQLGYPGRATSLTTTSLVSSTRTAARIDLFDALGRQLQTQRDAVVDGKRRIVIEDTRRYDQRGRVSRTYAPFVQTRTTGAYQSPPNNWGATQTTYDDLDRVVSVQQPDGSLRYSERNVAWQTTVHDACSMAGSCAGSQTTERRDAFGRVVETQVLDGQQFAAATRRTYDGLGRLLGTIQATAPGVWSAATATAIEYDSLGRRIGLSDPDSGTWRYGYDLTNRLLFVDDPSPNQHVAYCYDAVGRVTDKSYGTGDAYADPCAGGGRGQVAYTYDQHDATSGLDAGFVPRAAVGRLTRVEDSSGSTVMFYDVLGRTKLVGTTIAPPGAAASTAVVRYAHDAADHLVAVTYPDGELVKYSFDAVGQVRAMRGRQSYLRKLTYDVYGRPRELRHGNAVSDLRAYGGAAVNYRLFSNESKRGAQSMSRLVYAHYNANGLIETIDDGGPTGTSPTLNRSMTMAYDGVGRLATCVTVDSPGPQVYGYDALGNLTLKDGMSLTYHPHKPHTLTAINGSAAGLAHDDNGNRRGKPGFVYEFDQDDHLIGINHDSVQFVYNHAGQRVATAHSGQWTRYYGNLAEAGDGYLSKYYFVGPLLVASQRVANLELSGRAVPGPIQLAGFSFGNGYGLRLLLRPDLAPLAGLLVAMLTMAVLTIPGRRPRVVGLAVRRGPVLLLILLWTVSTLPVPVLVRPAAAEVPARGEVRHYHLDHLGSTQMVTDSRGQVLMHVRYAPYGQVLGYFAADGTRLGGTCGGAQSCREFTGYESEPMSGLQYAGARFYDPQLGTFLTHDPARQFASPYTYAGWNPTNLTDPNGEFITELLSIIGWAVVAALASAAVNTIIAAAQGASLAQIGRAATSGAITGAVSVGMGIVLAGANIGLAAVADTLPANVGGAQGVVQALGEVAQRSAFAGTVSNWVGENLRTAGAPGELATGLSVVSGYFASAVYDQSFLNSSGPLAAVEENGDFGECSNVARHTAQTTEAADGLFSPEQTDQIVAANVAQDGPGGFWGFLSDEVLTNQNHFGAGARQAADGALRDIGAGTAGPGGFLDAVGKASHFVQDQYALGHMFPGTHLLTGKAGAIPRFILHQTFGGEATFRGAQFDATRSLFKSLAGPTI